MDPSLSSFKAFLLFFPACQHLSKITSISGSCLYPRKILAVFFKKKKKKMEHWDLGKVIMDIVQVRDLWQLLHRQARSDN